MTLILNSSSDSNSTVLANVSCRSVAEDTSVRAVKILVYILVLIVSLIGNCVIITTVERNKQMRTTINFLVANMAASDLPISIFAVPIKLCETVVDPRRWLLDGIVGLISCKISYFLQGISTAVSIQSLVVIVIDRYREIVCPFRPAIITPKSCKIIIPLAWFSSMGLHAIYVYTIRLFSENGKTYCKINWGPAFDPHKAKERYVTILLSYCLSLS